MEKYYSEKYNFDRFRDKDESARGGFGSDKPRSRRTRRNPSKPRRYSDTKRTSTPPAPYKAPKASKPSPSRRRPPKKKMTKGRKALVALISVIIIGAIAATACIVGLNMYRDYKMAQPFKFSDNVKIGGISVGGMELKDAKAKLEENKMSIVNSFSLKVTANGEERKLSKYDFEYDFDFTTPLKNAKKYSLMDQDIYDEPESTAPTTEATVATELTEDEIDFKVSYSVNRESVKAEVKEFAKLVNIDPVDAKITAFYPFASKRFTYKRGEVGYSLKQAELTKSILKFLSSGKDSKHIKAEVETLSPDITVDDLEEKIVGLSTATSISYNNKNANNNMAVALKACNGSIIQPGETWSFNDCTGDSNLKSNGYKKATVIVEGKYEEGYGGGICQASTTIFKAALFANAAIIQRNAHYWASDYAYAGEDATIDYPDVDLCIENTTRYPMFLECKMEGTVLTANFWGVQEDYYDNIKIASENYDIVKKQSYQTVTKRYLYLNGEIVNEEEVCYSWYSLTDNHSIRDEDKGTFRTTVDGVTKIEEEKAPETETETEPETEAETTPQSDEQPPETYEDAMLPDDQSEYSDEAQQ